MPRYYCDYCNAYLTHDSPSVRKQHNAGYKHKANVRQYYQQFEEQHTQSLIDQRIREHHGQTAAADAAFSRYQMGAAPFNQYARLPTFPIHPPPQPTALYNPALRSNAFIHPPGYGVCPLLSPGASVHSHPTDGVPGFGLHSALTCAAYSSPRMPATTTIYNEYNLVPQQPNEYNVYESLGKHDSSVSQDLWVSPPGCE